MAHKGKIYPLHFRRDVACDLFTYRTACAYGYHYGGSAHGGLIGSWLSTHFPLLLPVDEKTRPRPLWRAINSIPGVGDVAFEFEIAGPVTTKLNCGRVHIHKVGFDDYAYYDPLPGGPQIYGNLPGKLRHGPAYDPVIYNIVDGIDDGDLEFITWAEYNLL